MDYISIIGEIFSLKTIARIVQQCYYEIDPSLNISKSGSVGREPAEPVIDDQIVPFINCFESGFRFLGCYLGNFDEIRNHLSSLMENFEEERIVLSHSDIEKHLKFDFLRICYSGQITHILRSTSPSLSLEFCRIFNELRTKFFANMLDIDSSFLRSHIFCSTELGGLDVHKSNYLCKATFIGGGKNFVLEFLERFPENQHLIEHCVSDFLVCRMKLNAFLLTTGPNAFLPIFKKFHPEV
ncbi:hypothetical protein P9112_005476 [Eukaryota sp. TZLM1-RC]